MKQLARAQHMPAALRLCGSPRPLRRCKCERWIVCVARHEGLRTSFVLLNGEPVQRRCSRPRTSASRCVEQDLVQMPADAQAAPCVSELEIAERSCGAAVRPRREGPLIRGELLRVADDEHLLLIDQHHIVSDGWSIGVLVQEVSALYAAFSAGSPDPLPPLALQYADYAAWQRAWLQGEALRTAQVAASGNSGHLAGAPVAAGPADRPDAAAGAELSRRRKQWSLPRCSTRRSLRQGLEARWRSATARRCSWRAAGRPGSLLLSRLSRPGSEVVGSARPWPTASAAKSKR